MVCAEEARRLSAFPGNDRRRENVWKKEKADVVCHVFQMFPYTPLHIQNTLPDLPKPKG
jgi:hypothetical protein